MSPISCSCLWSIWSHTLSCPCIIISRPSVDSIMVSVALTSVYLPLVLFPSREIGNDIDRVVVHCQAMRNFGNTPCGALGCLDHQCWPKMFGRHV